MGEHRLESWIWGHEEAGKFDGHDIPEADALRLVRDEFGWDVSGVEVVRVYVVRDPEKDGKGDADEAYKKCEADTPGAEPVTLVVS